MKTIGFAGTAKNTGKTTTAVEVLEQALAVGMTAALTSIGFDGEALDHVTGLPKPRFLLTPGTLVATAQGCLEGSEARFEILKNTGIRTILGKILIARVTRSGLALLAGPNRRSDLRTVCAEFAAAGADLTLADGALNRLVPMMDSDGLVLSTGAAYDEDIHHLAAHAAGLAMLFRLPQISVNGSGHAPMSLTDKDGQTRHLNSGSLLSPEALQEVLQEVGSRAQRLVIPDACYPRLLEALPERLAGGELVFGSPLKMIASGDPLQWRKVMALCERHEVRTGVLESLPLRLMTVNPFYPRYNPQKFAYEAAYVDAVELLSAVKLGVQDVPVVDVRQPPRPDMNQILWK